MPEFEVRQLLRIRCEYCRNRVCMDQRARSSFPVCHGGCALREELDDSPREEPAAGDVELLAAAIVD